MSTRKRKGPSTNNTSSTAERKEKKTKPTPVVERAWDLVDAGDTKRPAGVELVPNAIESKQASELFAELRKLPFVRLPVRGQTFKRAKVMYVDVNAEGTRGSLYRFPMGNDAGQKVPYYPMSNAPASVLKLRKEHAPGSNNIIVSLFGDHKTGITMHSDNRSVKYADMTPGQPIVDLVLMQHANQVRPFQYQVDGQDVVWNLPAGHGSKVVLSDAANRAGKHAVPKVLKKQCSGERISIVFRTIQSQFDVTTKGLVM